VFLDHEMYRVASSPLSAGFFYDAPRPCPIFLIAVPRTSFFKSRYAVTATSFPPFTTPSDRAFRLCGRGNFFFKNFDMLAAPLGAVNLCLFVLSDPLSPPTFFPPSPSTGHHNERPSPSQSPSSGGKRIPRSPLCTPQEQRLFLSPFSVRRRSRSFFTLYISEDEPPI